jgi:hypothetical protein
MNTVYCLEEWRGKQRISPPGDYFTPRGQNSPLGDNFAPGGCQMVYVFAFRKSQFEKSSGDPGMKNVGIFYAHLEYFRLFGTHRYFTTVWYKFWSFGVFFPIWYVVPEKNQATLSKSAILICEIKFASRKYF